MDFIYFYIGAFVGGGLVLSGGLFAGRTGNAAALGSMPVPDGAGGTAQLIDRASLVVLERRLREAGLPLDALYDPAADWQGFGAASRRLARDRLARHRPRGRRGLGDHRLRGGGDRRRLPAGRAGAAAAPRSRPSSHSSISPASTRPSSAPAASARSPARSAAPACRSSTATSSTSTPWPAAGADRHEAATCRPDPLSKPSRASSLREGAKRRAKRPRAPGGDDQTGRLCSLANLRHGNPLGRAGVTWC